MRLKTESETRRACEARALRALKTLSHALPISLLILRKKTDCFAVKDKWHVRFYYIIWFACSPYQDITKHGDCPSFVPILTFS